MLKLWAAALGLESAAFAWLLASGQSASAVLAGYLLLHGAASAVITLLAWRLFPAPYRQPRQYVFALVFGFSLMVPLLGLAILLIGAVAGSLFPQLLKPRVFDAVAQPEFTVDAQDATQRPRGAAARALLLNPAAPATVREEALLAIDSAGAAGSGALLRDLLADPSDDLRLLAYGMLDRREKAVSKRLAAERRLLELAEGIDDRDAARTICGRIAQLYWELVYRGLAQGDNARFALEQALIYAERSLREEAGDGPTWLMIGRVRLQRGELRAAEGAFNEALSFQVPRARVLPYLAELRFAQRRYADVRKLMLELGRGTDAASLSALQEFWTV